MQISKFYLCFFFIFFRVKLKKKQFFKNVGDFALSIKKFR